MTTWLGKNLGTIITALILAGIVTLIVVNMIKRRKKGNPSSCCGNCLMCGTCVHARPQKGNTDDK